MRYRLADGERSSRYQPGQFVSAEYAERYPHKVVPAGGEVEQFPALAAFERTVEEAKDLLGVPQYMAADFVETLEGYGFDPEHTTLSAWWEDDPELVLTALSEAVERELEVERGLEEVEPEVEDDPMLYDDEVWELTAEYKQKE
jgi:hypothetical protein